MSTGSESPLQPARPPRVSSSWLHARELWAGLSIITMWLAVLFVGLFGGNIVSINTGGSSTTVPVVVALLPFVLPATISVGRRGFRDPSDPLRAALEEETQAREQLTVELSELRTRVA